MNLETWHAELQSELNAANDRSLVIVAAAVLEDSLRELVKANLAASPASADSLFDRNGLIKDFSAIIDFSFRLQVIDKQIFETLHTLRRIRNDCAHISGRIRLDQAPHRDRVASIKARFGFLQGERIDNRMAITIIAMNLMASFSGGPWTIRENQKMNGVPFGYYLFVKNGNIASAVYPKHVHPSQHEWGQSDT